jgi:hypothetical protein
LKVTEVLLIAIAIILGVIAWIIIPLIGALQGIGV